MLIEKDINLKDLRNMTGISSTAIVKKEKHENINTDILLKICVALKYDIIKIMEIEDEEHRSNLVKSIPDSDA